MPHHGVVVDDQDPDGVCGDGAHDAVTSGNGMGMAGSPAGSSLSSGTSTA